MQLYSMAVYILKYYAVFILGFFKICIISENSCNFIP